MQIYFHSHLWSYLPRVPILVEGTVSMGRFISVIDQKVSVPIFSLK